MRSLRQKLLLFILPLCLIPLVGISFFSYYQAKRRITEDRIVLYLEQIAQGLTDTMRLTLLEKKEETVSMGLYFTDFLSETRKDRLQRILDRLLGIHEVYDLLILFDVEGRIVLTSSIDRNTIDDPRPLDPGLVKRLQGENLQRYCADSGWLQQVRSGRVGFLDWHQSPLVHQLYNYGEDDIARSYSIGFAAPVLDERGVVIGGILSLMNWEFIQEILDHLEEEMENRSLSSGYAFLFERDADTIIGHKYRRNRQYYRDDLEPAVQRDNYGTSLVEDHGLEGLHLAVQELLADPIRQYASHFAYQYPPGTEKISGLAALDHEYFAWVCGVGINDEEIFAPVQDLKNVLIVAALFSSALVIWLTFSVARQITTPLKKLTVGARIIADGDLSQRVEVSSQDETGRLAKAFNDMAESLQERSQALLDLNRKLEQKVEERTRELKRSHQEVERAYQELKDTQVQLIQSEKMASLGQLVAGIAHEIKNPLNFIYGNTDFLRKYLASLKELIRVYDEGTRDYPELRTTAETFKEECNYEFLLQDLDTLMRNFEEGAKRIHSIIGDLRAFSRLDSDEFRLINIHEPIEQALNLLRHEYRDRVRIHKEYGDLPMIECHSGKMSQVFMNLLANACQAIEGEGDIWIRSFSQDSRVVIEIEDNGPGIEESHLNKVFEPFFTTKPVGRGTGLGLSISYGIIRQHRGRISVQSEKTKGTRFRIELPVKE